jgi:hypothetical protein
MTSSVVDGAYDVRECINPTPDPLTAVYGICILIGTVIGSIAGISGVDGYSGETYPSSTFNDLTN